MQFGHLNIFNESLIDHEGRCSEGRFCFRVCAHRFFWAFAHPAKDLQVGIERNPTLTQVLVDVATAKSQFGVWCRAEIRVHIHFNHFAISEASHFVRFGLQRPDGGRSGQLFFAS